MANHNMSPSEVRSICEDLEVSPSKHAKSSPIRHGGSKAAAKGSTPSHFGHSGVTGGKKRRNVVTKKDHHRGSE